jgi:flagellar biogenesis protein FliO
LPHFGQIPQGQSRVLTIDESKNRALQETTSSARKPAKGAFKMLSDLISDYGGKFLVAALGVSLALLCLFIVLWVLRNRAPSPFVRGGRNRQPRLQVLDAAAIDTRRRIVLIRRDNVEHLVMIGGPTDLVIESGIGDERHYLTARALQAQTTEEEVRLTHQAGASLPPIEAGSPPALARDNRAEAPASRIEREPQLAPSQQASTPTVRPPVQTAQPIAPKAEVATPRPAGTVATPPAAPAAKSAATPIAAAVATAAVASPAMAAPVQATAAQRPSEPSVTSAPSAESRVAQAPATAPVSASFSPELGAELEEPAPTIVVDRPVDAAPPAAPLQQPTLAVSAPVEPGQYPRIEPVITTGAANSTETAPIISPEVASPSAEEVLEAARARVLVAPVNESQIRPFEADRFVSNNQAGATAEGSSTPKREEIPAAREMSDFERVLEDEMALHIAADPGPARVEAPAVAPISALLPETRSDRPRPPLGIMGTDPRQPTSPAGANTANAAEEPNLQNEIARIFGEMSASRNP